MLVLTPSLTKRATRRNFLRSVRRRSLGRFGEDACRDHWHSRRDYSRSHRRRRKRTRHRKDGQPGSFRRDSPPGTHPPTGQAQEEADQRTSQFRGKCHMLIDVWHALGGHNAPVQSCILLRRRAVKGLLRGDGPRYVGAWNCLACRGWVPPSVPQHGVVVLDCRVYRAPGQLVGSIHSIPDLDRALADMLVLQRAECAPAHTPAHAPPTHTSYKHGPQVGS